MVIISRIIHFFNNILIIVDEIWNGFGRTGNFFSFQNFNLKPDLVCAGKAMSSSLPLSVVLGPSKILKTWPPGIHTSTFQGNPLSCAMASATIDEILKSKLINRAKKIRGAQASKVYSYQLDLINKAENLVPKFEGLVRELNHFKPLIKARKRLEAQLRRQLDNGLIDRLDFELELVTLFEIDKKYHKALYNLINSGTPPF